MVGESDGAADGARVGAREGEAVGLLHQHTAVDRMRTCRSKWPYGARSHRIVRQKMLAHLPPTRCVTIFYKKMMLAVPATTMSREERESRAQKARF